MKLVYSDMGHILRFGEGYVPELVIENKKMFFNMVDSMARQADGMGGDCVLSVSDRPVDFCKYADLIVQFAPFEINRKSLLTKLYAALEQKAHSADLIAKTAELLSDLERYMLELAEDYPFEISCRKLAVGSVIRALSPEVEESDQTPLERVFSYMELVRDLDRDKLFVMVNMRSYFQDEEMELFTQSVAMHNFNVLLLENHEATKLNYTKRFVIDGDLCEF